MDGLSRWDFVLWVVAAYVAVMVIVRMMLGHRDAVVRRLRDQAAAATRRKPVAKANENLRDAA